MKSEGFVMRNGRRIAVVSDDLDYVAKPKRKRRDFVMVTRAQFERLITIRSVATVRIFLHLQFLIFKSYTKSARLTPASLTKNGIVIDPKTKQAALLKLEKLGLIQVTRFRHHSPEIVILDLPEAAP